MVQGAQKSYLGKALSRYRGRFGRIIALLSSSSVRRQCSRKMSSFFSPFSSSRAGNAWFHVGSASSFPNITANDTAQISEHRPCSSADESLQGCKVFHVPKEDSSRATEVPLDGSVAPPEAGGLRDQVMVFQYNGKFHAVNHVSCITILCLSADTEFVTDLDSRNVHIHLIHCPTVQPLILRTSV